MKKIVLIAIIFGIILGISWWGYREVRKKTTNKQTFVAQEIAEKLLVWKDPAGFTFSYPEGVMVDKHDEDKENYAHIEMTHPNHLGGLIVWAKDTIAVNTATWVKTEKMFSGASIVDTTLGGKPAKKILLETNKIIIGTIYEEIVWYIEVEPSDTYWQKTLDTIIQSFTFVSLPSESAPVEEEVSVDEEEIIE